MLRTQKQPSKTTKTTTRAVRAPVTTMAQRYLPMEILLFPPLSRPLSSQRSAACWGAACWHLSLTHQYSVSQIHPYNPNNPSSTANATHRHKESFRPLSNTPHQHKRGIFRLLQQTQRCPHYSPLQLKGRKPYSSLAARSASRSLS